jgi:hypothetical protein
MSTRIPRVDLPSDVERRFFQSLHLLSDSCELFDFGKTYHILPISNLLRLLVIDKPGRFPLISLATRYFGNDYQLLTSVPTNYFSIGDVAPVFATCPLHSYFSAAQGSSFVPILDGRGWNEEKLISRDEWLDEQLYLANPNSPQITRRSIILSLCETDGGTHFDDTLPKAYVEELINSQQGLTANFRPVIDALEATLRQIAHEFLRTIALRFEKEGKPVSYPYLLPIDQPYGIYQQFVPPSRSAGHP